MYQMKNEKAPFWNSSIIRLLDVHVTRQLLYIISCGGGVMLMEVVCEKHILYFFLFPF